MSFRGAHGSLRRGFARMVKPLKSGLTSSRSREEELRDEREFERLFVLFEAFLQTERRPSPAPSSPSTSSSASSSPLALRQLVSDDSSTPLSDGDAHDGQDKAKRRRRLSFMRERRNSSNSKKKDKRNSRGSSEECEAPKGVCMIAPTGDDDSNNQGGGGNAEVNAEDEEHEVRFVVGLLNGYLALKRLGDGDKNLTFSLANNKKKEEERERKELEKLRGEIVLRMTSALTDLGALPDAGSPSAGDTSAAPTGIARHQSAHAYPTQASRSPSIAPRHARTSWRGRLRNKEKTASLEEPSGKDKKQQQQQQEEDEERSPTPAQKNEVNDSPPDWRDRLISPRALHKRSQSLTFEPQGAMSMPLDTIVADEEEDFANEPRIPLVELEERLRKMEELIDLKFAAKLAGSPSDTPDSKKSKRRSLNMLLRRSSGAKDKADSKDSIVINRSEKDDDGAVDGEGSVICAIPTSIYTKVTNRRSVYHYNIEAIREMIHQHADGQPSALEGDDKPKSKASAESGTSDGSSVDETSILLVGKSEGDDDMIGSSVTIMLTTPSSPPVPSLDLTELPRGEGFLSPESATQAFQVNVSSTSTSEFIPSVSSPTTTAMTMETETVAASNWRRTVHNKRDKMLRMRVIDSKFGPAKNVKWAFLWCEENVAPATFVKVVKAQAFARRFLVRRLRKRLQIANELLVTEKHYVDILDLLVKVFLQPLRDSDLLPQESVRAIFGNTEALRDKHLVFHELLHKRVRDWMTFRQFGVGDIFYDHADFMLAYTEYVNNFDSALATLTQCTKNSPEFALFVRTCEARPECNLHDLPSMLITPVQRIPRYTLLLQDLQRHTPSNPRRGLLEMALKKVRDIANYINEQKRVNENAVKMTELESRLVFDPKPKTGLCEVPSRKFIKEGKVLIQLGRKQFKECHVFLFTDLLLITKKEDLDDNDEEASEKEKEKEKEIERKRSSGGDADGPPRYLVKAAEPLNENPIEISPLPPFFLDKATRFPLRLYFSSQRKENERDDWLQRIVSAHASARRRPYSILTVRRGFTAGQPAS